MINFAENKKLLISVSIALTIFLLFLLFIYIPKNRKVAKLKVEIKTIDQQIKSIQTILGDMRHLGEILFDMQSETTSFENRIPRKEEVSSILSECSSLAKECSIEVVSIKSKDPRPFLDKEKNTVTFGDKALEAIEIDLALLGTYKALADYIKSIQESLNILATIHKISIKKDETRAPQHDIRLVLNVYISRN